VIPSVGIPRAEGVGIVLPAVTTVLLALIGVVPLHIPGYAAVVPAFTLMGVFHWTLYRPDLLPPTVIFLIGLFLDLLTGAHFPGVSPFVLLLGHAIVEHNRKLFVGRPFPFVWGGFALTAAASIAALWGLNSMLETTLLDARLSAFRWVLSVAFYPAASYLLGRIQRALLPA
jgi:rod shape-determining protein MreD